MIEGDSVNSTPRTDSSSIQANGNIVKLPYSVSRRVYSKKARGSKNGTAAGIAAHTCRTRPVKVLTGANWEEIRDSFTPDEQRALMADVWKVLNRHFRKL
jgi:hypothetical protein